jgi:hypothetical protein
MKSFLPLRMTPHSPIWRIAEGMPAGLGNYLGCRAFDTGTDGCGCGGYGGRTVDLLSPISPPKAPFPVPNRDLPSSLAPFCRCPTPSRAYASSSSLNSESPPPRLPTCRGSGVRLSTTIGGLRSVDPARRGASPPTAAAAVAATLLVYPGSEMHMSVLACRYLIRSVYPRSFGVV